MSYFLLVLEVVLVKCVQHRATKRNVGVLGLKLRLDRVD
jgi:hypothetical protein